MFELQQKPTTIKIGFAGARKSLMSVVTVDKMANITFCVKEKMYSTFFSPAMNIKTGY